MSIYRRLDRSNFQFDFAVNTEEPCEFDSEIRALGGRVFGHPAPAEAGFRRWGKAFERTLREHGPYTAVHSHIHFFSGYALETARKAGIPRRLAHSHSSQDGRADSLRRCAYRLWMRRLIRDHATHMLGCSRAACESLYGPSCWRDSRVRVFPNAIDPSSFEFISPDRCSLRKRLSLPAEGFLVGHVGRFHPVKNHRRLLDIFGAVRERRPEAHLVLAGEGPLRPEIESLIREKELENAVHLLGLRDDVPVVLGALDVFVFPSLYEGLPIALLEAQAAGLPCVVSDTVPPEADVKMGLVRFVNLKSSDKTWADQVMIGLKSAGVAWPDRKEALQVAGYDIRLQVMALEGIYAGDRN